MGMATIFSQQMKTNWTNVCYPDPRSLNIKYIAIGPMPLEEKTFESVNSCDLETKVKGYPLTLSLIYFHVLAKLSICAKYDTSTFNSSWEICFSIIFPWRYIRKPTWPLCRKVKGQLRIIIWIYLVGVKSRMLYTKFQISLFLGSGKDFKGFLPYIGTGGILANWQKTFKKKIILPTEAG